MSCFNTIQIVSDGYEKVLLLLINLRSKALNGHSKSLNGHSKSLNGHSKSLNGHSKALNRTFIGY